MRTSRILDFKDIFLQTKVCAKKARKLLLRYYGRIREKVQDNLKWVSIERMKILK